MRRALLRTLGRLWRADVDLAAMATQHAPLYALPGAAGVKAVAKV